MSISRPAGRPPPDRHCHRPRDPDRPAHESAKPRRSVSTDAPSPCSAPVRARQEPSDSKRQQHPRRSKSRAMRAISKTSRADTRSPSRSTPRTPTSRRFFKGLPDDRCQAAHWGYVIQRAVDLQDGGWGRDVRDRYYVTPGHTAVLYAGTEIVEFSPTRELQETLEVVTRNMESPGG
jgi:hypothetical protein